MPACIVNQVNLVCRCNPQGLEFLDKWGNMIPKNKEDNAFEIFSEPKNPDSDDDDILEITVIGIMDFGGVTSSFGVLFI